MRLLIAFSLALAAVLGQPPTELVQPVSPWRTMAEIDVAMDEIAATSEAVRRLPFGAGDRDIWPALYLVGAPERLSDLEEFLRGAEAFAHPLRTTDQEKQALRAELPLIAVVTAGVHALEPSAVHGMPSLLSELAARHAGEEADLWRQIVVILVPCIDREGHDAAVRFWRATASDEALRGRPPPELIHRVAGRDLNRDALFLTQPESRLLVKGVYGRFWPQLVIDRHEMPDREGGFVGNARPRLFVPPYREPYEPNVHALQREGLIVLGAEVQRSLVEAGHRGLCSGRYFDGYSPARGAPFYFGALRFLIEVAHAEQRPGLEPPTLGPKGSTGEPAFEGGPWTFKDAVRLSNAATLATLSAAAQRRASLLANYERIRRDQGRPDLDGQAFALIKTETNELALRRALDVFAHYGIETEELTEGAIDSASETEIPPGSLIVPRAQPMGSWVAAVLENAPYPEGFGQPYDWTSHTLTAWLGLEGLRVAMPPKERLLPVRMRPLFRPVLDDERMAREGEAFALEGLGAALDLLGHLSRGGEALMWPKTATHGAAIALRGEGRMRFARSTDRPEGPSLLLRAQAIGVLTSQRPEEAEGFFLDWFAMTGIAIRRIPPETEALTEALASLDVLLLPPASPEAFLSSPRRPAGAASQPLRLSRLWPALKAFLDRGGRLVAVGRSLPLVTPLLNGAGSLSFGGRFGGPQGAHVLVERETTALGFALRESSFPLLFSEGLWIDAEDLPGFEPLWRVVPKEPFVAGATAGVEAMGGRTLAGRLKVGQGEILWVGVSPSARGATWSTFLPFAELLLPPFRR